MALDCFPPLRKQTSYTRTLKYWNNTSSKKVRFKLEKLARVPSVIEVAPFTLEPHTTHGDITFIFKTNKLKKLAVAKFNHCVLLKLHRLTSILWKHYPACGNKKSTVKRAAAKAATSPGCLLGGRRSQSLSFGSQSLPFRSHTNCCQLTLPNSRLLRSAGMMPAIGRYAKVKT